MGDYYYLYLLKIELKKNKAMKIQAQPRINNSCQSAPFSLKALVIRTVSLKALVICTVCCVVYLVPLLHETKWCHLQSIQKSVGVARKSVITELLLP